MVGFSFLILVLVLALSLMEKRGRRRADSRYKFFIYREGKLGT